MPLLILDKRSSHLSQLIGQMNVNFAYLEGLLSVGGASVFVVPTASVGGTVDSITLTIAGFAAYSDYLFVFTPVGANTSTVQCRVNALAYLPIQKPGGSALGANDLAAVPTILKGDGASFKIIAPI